MLPTPTSNVHNGGDSCVDLCVDCSVDTNVTDADKGGAADRGGAAAGRCQLTACAKKANTQRATCQCYARGVVCNN